MKVLVYGTGVIGSLLIHNLILAGNDITAVVRNNKSMDDGYLHIKIGKKEWKDHLRIIPAYDKKTYDVTFCVMQNQQAESILEILGKIDTKYLVFVGNNMTSSSMEEKLLAMGFPKENLFFGFQTSGGKRYENYTEAVTFGKTTLTLGHIHKEPEENEKNFFKSLFKKTSRLEFMDDMDGWYKCHMAFILPIAYISYSKGCSLRKCSMRDMKNYMEAGKEIYVLYQSLDIKIRPMGDEKNTRGIRRSLYTFFMWVTGHTKMGELAITDHLRNAVDEMEFMEGELMKIRKMKEVSLPVFDSLKAGCPSWCELKEIYKG